MTYESSLAPDEKEIRRKPVHTSKHLQDECRERTDSDDEDTQNLLVNEPLQRKREIETERGHQTCKQNAYGEYERWDDEQAITEQV